MSGGNWNYQSFRIQEEADRIHSFLKAVGDSEHIIDWAESCDTSRELAEKELYELWLKVFDEWY